MAELLAPTGASGLPPVLRDPERRHELEAGLPGYLAGQRWFGGKARTLVDSAISGWVALDDVGSAVLCAVAVRDVDDHTTEHVIVLSEGDAGEIVEGLDNAPAALGLYRCMFGGRVEGEGIAIVGQEGEPAAALGARAMPGEQSNSSVVYDNGEVAKLYRRLRWGPNPEIEMAQALAGGGFTSMPAYIGSAVLERPDGATAGLALVQEFLADAEDCWDAAMRMGEAFLQTGERAVFDLLERLGGTTSLMHLVLAHAREAAFVPRRAGPPDVQGWFEDLRAEAAAALELIEGSSEAGPHADALRACRELQVWAGEGDAGLLIRVHGDYHLGQVLSREERLFVVDFEGEPARDLEARRALQSPLVDVAGMLRSWGYAVSQLAMRTPAGHEGSPDELAARGRRAFLDGYYAGVSGSDTPILPADEQERDRLLGLLELRKAIYELVYETNNRPDWAWIPALALPDLLTKANA